MNHFMKITIDEALKGVDNGDGGPFGAVIVQNGIVISSAHNEVLKTNDPTAHAEVLAIRRASSILNRFDLSDCIIYSSCEPCPMCLAAIYWAKIKTLYYGCTKVDAQEIGFDDNFIYNELSRFEKERLECKCIDRDDCLVPFEKWLKKKDRISY